MNNKGIDIEYMAKLKGKRHPLVVGIELTEQCNLRCIHCCIRADGNRPRHQELTTAQWRRVLREMREARVIYILLTGGEPLRRSDFKKVYLSAKKMNFAVTVATNGTLITKDLIELFQKYPPLMLEITSYGVNRKAYESVTRIPGSYEAFQKAIGLLSGSGIRFAIRTMVVKKTFNEVLENHQNIKASGIKCVFGLPLLLRRDRDKRKNDLIRGQRLGPKEIAVFMRHFSEGGSKSQKEKYSAGRRIEGCGCYSLGGTVLSDGTWTSCQHIAKSYLNLKKVSFADAWDRSSMGEMLSAKQDAACGECEHKVYCRWCPGIAYLETGNPKAKVPYLCRIMETMRKKGACQ